MNYTLSFDASIKVNKQNIKGLLNHNFRDVLEKNGKIQNHKNENIDSSKTIYNESIYYNQITHCFEKCSSISQIEDSINTRLAKVKKPLRKDAVIARAIVLQLDGEWFKQNNKGMHPNLDMLQWAVEVFGEENIVGASIHKDEANPHLHLLFTPVTADGRLSQKDWFKDPKTLSAMHDDFRAFMRARGYDIEYARQPKRKHLSEQDYKTFRQAEEKIKEINKRETELEIQKNEANKMQQQVQGELKVAKQYAESVRRIYERFKHTIEAKDYKLMVDELEQLDESLLPQKNKNYQKTYHL